MNVGEIIKMIEALEQEKHEYSKALVSLRGKNWINGIDSDTRAAVQSIYKLYNEKDAEIKKYLGYHVKI